MLQSASQDYIASTMMHETLHAYMRHQRFVLPREEFNAKFPVYADNLIPNDTLGIASHSQMAKDMIDKMTEVVRVVNPNISVTDANALSWGGLWMTRAWTARTDKDYINLVNSKAKNPSPQDVTTYKLLPCATQPAVD